MIKKMIGSIIALAGFVICGWGIYLFGMSIYYLAAKNQEMGPAAGIGYSYGIMAIIIGLVLLVFGGIILFNKKEFTKKQNIIIPTMIIFILMFMGFDTKVFVLKEDAKMSQTYVAATFYGHPVGGQIAVYEKKSKEDRYAPRRMLSKLRKGIAEFRIVGQYKYWLIIITLLIGFILFVRDKRNIRNG